MLRTESVISKDTAVSTGMEGILMVGLAQSKGGSSTLLALGSQHMFHQT